jgi:hypothetical protein
MGSSVIYLDNQTETAMFCPRCRAEYRPGFYRCSDCAIELVDQLPPNPSSGERTPEIDQAELVVLRSYPTVIEAELAKSALESVGIDSMIRTDNEGGQSPALSMTRGVELLVRASDAQAANDMLGVEGVGDEGSD